MDKRFKIEPQLTSIEFGPEPALFDIIVKYYTSSGIELRKAKAFATKYVKEWIRCEKSIA